MAHYHANFSSAAAPTFVCRARSQMAKEPKPPQPCPNEDGECCRLGCDADESPTWYGKMPNKYCQACYRKETKRAKQDGGPAGRSLAGSSRTRGRWAGNSRTGTMRAGSSRAGGSRTNCRRAGSSLADGT